MSPALSPDVILILAAAGLVALAMLGSVFAWSWKAWLDLRRHQLDGGIPTGRDIPAVANRIDLADLRERIKKLEAIAAGVDF